MEVTPLTFGVEIEAVCPYSYPRSLEPEPDHKDKLARPLLIPENTWDHNSRAVRQRLAQFIKSIDVPDGVRPPPRKNRRRSRYGLGYEEDFLDWEVSYDGSIGEYSAEHVGYEGEEDIEIKSPILWATESSFLYVARVLRLLIENFRLRINLTTGLHVHVARGVNRHFSQQEMRHFGALVWSSERLLYTLQPAERRVNTYSKCIRTDSHLARGQFAEDDDFGTWYTSGKGLHSVASSETSIGSQKRFERPRPQVATAMDIVNPPREPSPSPVKGIGAALRFSSTRTPIPRPDPKKDESQLYRRRNSATFGPPPIHDGEPTLFLDSAREGARRVLESKDRHDIAVLLGWTEDRLGWNFEPWTRNKMRRTYTKMTIECRAGHGSVDPWWVATWARIVVGIAQFAIDAPRVKYLEVLDRLAKAEEDDGRFVVDDKDKPRRLKISDRDPEEAVRKMKEGWLYRYEHGLDDSDGDGDHDNDDNDDDAEHEDEDEDEEEEEEEGEEKKDDKKEEKKEEEEKEEKKKEEEEEKKEKPSDDTDTSTSTSPKEGGKAEEKGEQGMKKPCTYDIVDFLQDVGLFAEAMYIEKYMLKDPDTFWFPHHPLMQENANALSSFGDSSPQPGSSDAQPPTNPSSSESSMEPAFAPRVIDPESYSQPTATAAAKAEGGESDTPPAGGAAVLPPFGSRLPPQFDDLGEDLYYNSDDDPIPPPPPSRPGNKAAAAVGTVVNRDSHASDATVVPGNLSSPRKNGLLASSSVTTQNKLAENQPSTEYDETSENSDSSGIV